jgi:endonuclease/exonuclease/phosphatase (EEP) superfamily protein YafD
VLATLLSFGARWWWVLELATHFRAHYCVELLIGAVFAAMAKRWQFAAVFVVAAAVNFAFIAPLYVPAQGEANAGQTIRIVLANVNVHNRDHEPFLRLVRDESPDVVVVLEVNNQWLTALKALEAEYPHRVSRARADSFGLAIFSRLPAADLKILEIGPAKVPSVMARLDCGEGVLLNLIATHPVPPTSADYAEMPNDQLRNVAQLAATLPRPAAIVGDLNSTSWSPLFCDLVSVSGLGDSRRGFGVQPSWPGRLAAIGIPIDHVLVSSDVAAVRRGIGPDIGSDHRPVIVDLTISGQDRNNASSGSDQ